LWQSVTRRIVSKVYPECTHGVTQVDQASRRLASAGTPDPGVPKSVPSRLPRRLTTAVIEKLGETTITDPAVRGLMVRVRTSERGTVREFRFRYKMKGETQIITLGRYPSRSLASAREQAHHFRELLRDNIDPRRSFNRRFPAKAAAPATQPPQAAEAMADPHSVTALVHEFTVRHLRPRRKRPEYAEQVLEREVVKHWATRDARTIQPREVIELLDAIVDRGSPVTANRTAGLLTQLFKFAVHRQIVAASPVQLLYRPGGPERPRQRVLDDDELTALLLNLDTVMKRAPRTAIAIRLFLYTAVRRSELALARWSELTLGDNAVWTIPGDRTKTGVPYLVPLVPEAVAQFRVLKAQAARSSFVFPAMDDAHVAADPKLLTRSIARHMPVFAQFKVGGFTAHDLRRTVRTGLARLKVAPHIAERALNHAQPGIVATYDVHGYLDEKREALEKWAAHLRMLGV